MIGGGAVWGIFIGGDVGEYIHMIGAAVRFEVIVEVIRGQQRLVLEKGGGTG